MSLPNTFAHAAPGTSPDIRVEVTGSNIRRVEGEGALPVQVITRQEIEQQGIQTSMALVESAATEARRSALRRAPRHDVLCGPQGVESPPEAAGD